MIYFSFMIFFVATVALARAIVPRVGKGAGRGPPPPALGSSPPRRSLRLPPWGVLAVADAVRPELPVVAERAKPVPPLRRHPYRRSRARPDTVHAVDEFTMGTILGDFWRSVIFGGVAFVILGGDRLVGTNLCPILMHLSSLLLLHVAQWWTHQLLCKH